MIWWEFLHDFVTIVQTWEDRLEEGWGRSVLAQTGSWIDRQTTGQTWHFPGCIHVPWFVHDFIYISWSRYKIKIETRMLPVYQKGTLGMITCADKTEYHHLILSDTNTLPILYCHCRLQHYKTGNPDLVVSILCRVKWRDTRTHSHSEGEFLIFGLAWQDTRQKSGFPDLHLHCSDESVSKGLRYNTRRC